MPKQFILVVFELYKALQAVGNFWDFIFLNITCISQIHHVVALLLLYISLVIYSCVDGHLSLFWFFTIYK